VNANGGNSRERFQWISVFGSFGVPADGYRRLLPRPPTVAYLADGRADVFQARLRPERGTTRGTLERERHFTFFSVIDDYPHKLPCDATQIGRFRRVLGGAGVEQLLKTTIETAVAIKAVKPTQVERVIVDSTVHEKAIAHPTDSRLLEVEHVIHRGKHRMLTATQRSWLKRRLTTEPAIGHAQAYDRMDLC
jgi:hypothetical protein